MSVKRRSAIITAIVAGLMSNASYADTSAMSGGAIPTAAVHCMGINSCKGMGSCKTATNACKGMNSCKGKGIMNTTTAKDCTDKGGTVVQ